MAFRRSIPQNELRDKLTDSDREQHGTDYTPSRGGWVKRPAPAPTSGAGGTGRGRLFGRKP
ncbi:hypothetical protein ABZ845_30825 [Streptomyces sp. NPDC047022]|uniref:hypothetical protein n=1 Tax=Streptomyces sp. NPDC047022 TaxID=3155737 RepID=UPI0033DFEADA